MENLLPLAENESWQVVSVLIREESLQNTKVFKYILKDFFFSSPPHIWQ